MSSPEGRFLEDFVRDGLIDPTPADLARWLAAFAPHRAEIEAAIDDWYADDADGVACSWRDFRNSLWTTYAPEDGT